MSSGGSFTVLSLSLFVWDVDASSARDTLNTNSNLIIIDVCIRLTRKKTWTWWIQWRQELMCDIRKHIHIQWLTTQTSYTPVLCWRHLAWHAFYAASCVRNSFAALLWSWNRMVYSWCQWFLLVAWQVVIRLSGRLIMQFIYILYIQACHSFRVYFINFPTSTAHIQQPRDTVQSVAVHFALSLKPNPQCQRMIKPSCTTFNVIYFILCRPN